MDGEKNIHINKSNNEAQSHLKSSTNSMCIDVDKIEKKIIGKIKDYGQKIVHIKNKLLGAKFDFERNYLNKLLINNERKQSLLVSRSEERISFHSCSNLFKIREEWRDTSVRKRNVELFEKIVRWGDYNKTYKQCSPHFWSRGIYAGVYLDLLEIMKNPKKLNLPKSQVQKETVIANVLCELFVIEQSIPSRPRRYTFMNFLFKMMNYSDMLNFVHESVQVINCHHYGAYHSQIGYKKIKGTNLIAYYLRYGLPIGIPYKIGAINVNYKFFKRDPNKLKYAIHFVSKVNSGRYHENGNTIPIGERSLILTPVNKIGSSYMINKTCVPMVKDKIQKYICKNDKLSYEMAFVIDIQKLYETYKEDGQFNNIQKMDIGIMLVHKTIPGSCVVERITQKSIFPSY